MTQLLVNIAADINTTLTTKVSIGATTATLTSATDDDGVSLPNGTYGFTIDRNNAQKEYFTATLTGTALTNIKTVARGTGAGTSGLAREHRKGAEVIISDWVALKRMLDLLDGTTDFDASTPLGYDGTATISSDNQFATKAYVDGVAIAGGADSSTSVKGISKMSVAPASAANPIAVGDNDPRVPTTDENNAMVGTSGTPSSSNKYVTNDDTATAATADKVARRLATGDITVPSTPTNSTDAASKNYVDTSNFLTSGNPNEASTNQTETVLTYALAGGTLSTNRGVKMRIATTVAVSATNSGAVYNLKYGGTTIASWSSAGTSGTPTYTRLLVVDVVLMGSGATGTQITSMIGTAATTSGTGGSDGVLATSTTSSIDSTTSQNITIECVASASVTGTLVSYFIEKV